jgi:hypothetical protein
MFQLLRLNRRVRQKCKDFHAAVDERTTALCGRGPAVVRSSGAVHYDLEPRVPLVSRKERST